MIRALPHTLSALFKSNGKYCPQIAPPYLTYLYLIQTALNSFNLTGNSQIPYPVDILRSKWSKDICSLGSIVYPSQNASIDDLANQEKTVDFDYADQPRLLFAGDSTICDHFGTLHGARLSGIREANRIIESVKNRTFKRKQVH